jgi:hypothetical protein
VPRDVPSRKIIKRASQVLGFWQRLLRARLKYTTDDPRWKDVQAFCLFVGYPRSGSTLLASILNAHPDAVLAHEADVLGLVRFGLNRDQLCEALMHCADEFAASGNEWEGYAYNLGQWQGRHRTLRVLGDKEAGMTSVRLAKRPDLVESLQARCQVPIKAVHVVRHPLDNISTMFQRGRYPILGLPLSRCVADYERMCLAANRLGEQLPANGVLVTRHEDLLREPRAKIEEACKFLGLSAQPDYFDQAAGIVQSAPSQTRHQVEWSNDDLQAVRELVARVDSHQSYRGEISL